MEVVRGNKIPQNNKIIEVMRPPRPADFELSLQSTEVFLPQDLILINGQPFEVEVNTERLSTAVKVVTDNHGGRATQSMYPRQLVINTLKGEATGVLQTNAKPRIMEPVSKDDVPLLTALKDGGTSVNIRVPSKISSSQLTEAGLVKLITEKANHDLLVAFGQNISAKGKRRTGLRVASVVLAMAVGENVGAELASSWPRAIALGAGGLVVGAIAGGVGVSQMDRLRWGNNEKNFFRWAVEESRDYQDIHWELTKFARGDEIISLRPSETEQQD